MLGFVPPNPHDASFWPCACAVALQARSCVLSLLVSIGSSVIKMDRSTGRRWGRSLASVKATRSDYILFVARAGRLFASSHFRVFVSSALRCFDADGAYLRGARGIFVLTRHAERALRGWWLRKRAVYLCIVVKCVSAVGASGEGFKADCRTLEREKERERERERERTTLLWMFGSV